MPAFQLVSPFSPAGDQPKAIESLVKGIKQGKRDQVLLGVTGSGKTFTMANVIQEMQRPTLVLSHNKTLAAQLYSEFREFFPHNAVTYFVSYYDYYQPEAYVPRTDTCDCASSSTSDPLVSFSRRSVVRPLTSPASAGRSNSRRRCACIRWACSITRLSS